jgi:molybdenum-dependent DNA-binding transcriptional regulator ModE
MQPPHHPAELAMNMRRLRLRHLEVLLAIERHGSITGAAEALGATQPAVSQWLAEVESAIGAQLFTRGRQIQPTAFLPVALRHARRIVADSHQLQYELQAVASGSAGSVRMGVMRVAAVRLVPQALLQIGKLPQKPLVHVVEDIAAGCGHASTGKNSTSSWADWTKGHSVLTCAAKPCSMTPMPSSPDLLIL